MAPAALPPARRSWIPLLAGVAVAVFIIMLFANEPGTTTGAAASPGGQLFQANCASCHGVHNILPSSDPRSSVNAANLAKTCGVCHAGAGSRFTIARSM